MWFQLLNGCLSYDVSNIRVAAIKALPPLLTEYYQGNTEAQLARRAQIITDYRKNLMSINTEVTRMGYALALGSLPKFMLEDHLGVIMETLIESLNIKVETLKWAESRRDAVKAISSICVTMADSIGRGTLTNNLSQIKYTTGQLFCGYQK